MIIETAIGIGSFLLGGSTIAFLKRNKKNICEHNYEIVGHKQFKDGKPYPILVCCSKCATFTIKKYECVHCKESFWQHKNIEIETCGLTFFMSDSYNHKLKAIYLEKEKAEEIIFEYWEEYADKIKSSIAKIILEDTTDLADPLKDKFDVLAKDMAKNGEYGSIIYRIEEQPEPSEEVLDKFVKQYRKKSKKNV